MGRLGISNHALIVRETVRFLRITGPGLYRILYGSHGVSHGGGAAAILEGWLIREILRLSGKGRHDWRALIGYTGDGSPAYTTGMRRRPDGIVLVNRSTPRHRGLRAPTRIGADENDGHRPGKQKWRGDRHAGWF